MRQKALQTADEVLKAMSAEAPGLVTEKVDTRFGELEVTIGREMMAFVDEQVRNIQHFVELYQHNQADRERALNEMTMARSAVARCVKTLGQAAAVAKQS